MGRSTRPATAARRRARAQLYGLLRRGIVSGGDLEEAALLVRRAFAVEASVFNQGMTPFAGVARVDGVPDEWLAVYARVARFDPVPALLDRAPHGTVFHASRSRAHPELEHAFYDLAGWTDLATVLVPSPLGEPIFVALYRRSGRFDRRELEEISVLQAMLTEALATRAALEALAAPRDETTERALARFVTHASVSFPGAVCRWAEDAGSALGAFAGRYLTPADLGRLERALVAIAARRHRGRRHRFVHGLVAELACAPPDARESERVLVLILRDPLPPIDADAPVLAPLSRRQREVVLAVAAGRQLPEIARSLGIAAETARTHFRSASEVLGVADRAELVRLLAR